ncbi:MAG: hypothetical protein A2068_11385 [Ignavibacteria bacterium GWB2_35_6b]|nr:MAG: hypothetical protein A2068_11385 [Ignavibacteria bacterium GWB2_35_6b]
MIKETSFSKIPTTFMEMTKSFGVIWWLFHASLVVLGLLAIILPIQYPEWVTRAIPIIISSKFNLLFGIIFLSIPISHLVGHAFSYFLSVLFKLNPWATRENIFPPAILGVFEAVMIPLFFVIEKPEFTGAWLLLKVAGGWKGWQGNSESRRRFYKFLIGNIITIFIGCITFFLLKSFVLI